MVIAGLTGSIGMGKSAVAALFRARGIAVFDADAEVHRLYAGEAAGRIGEAFPGTVVDGRVDRVLLTRALGEDARAFARLERIVHPLVAAGERAFLRAEERRGAAIAVLEIPLLFEAGRAEKVDAVIVASAPADVQRARVLARPGMTAARLDALLARQLPDAEKRRRADFVVDTGGSLEESARQVDAIIAALGSIGGTAFERHWA